MSRKIRPFRFCISIAIALPLFLCCSSETVTPTLQFEQSSQTFPLRATNQIGLGDFDGDGDLDVVFSNMALDNSQILLNDGNGRFDDTGQELTRGGHGVGIGDLDGDSDLDLFMTCAGFDDGEREYDRRSKVYLNDGTGGFTDSGQDLGDSVPSGNSVDLFDYDADGDLDAFVTYYQLPDKVYLNDGEGRFFDSGVTMPENVDWADLDSDGDVDMFVRSPGEGFRTLLNDGDGNFSDTWAFEDTTFQRVLAHLGDINGDGEVDVIITHGRREGSYPTRLFLNDGSGGMELAEQALHPTFAGRIGLGDLDGDGDVDILQTSLGSPHAIWLNDGNGLFVDSGIRLENRGGVHSPLIRDVNGDGLLDIIVAHYSEGGMNEIWFNRVQ